MTSRITNAVVVPWKDAENARAALQKDLDSLGIPKVTVVMYDDNATEDSLSMLIHNRYLQDPEISARGFESLDKIKFPTMLVARTEVQRDMDLEEMKEKTTAIAGQVCDAFGGAHITRHVTQVPEKINFDRGSEKEVVRLHHPLRKKPAGFR